MVSRSVIVGFPFGLHARPSAVLADAVKSCGLRVTLTTEDAGPVPASSMLRVMALNIQHGQRVTLHAHGPGAADALNSLARAIEASP